MNYEDFYAKYSVKEKELRTQIAEQQKCYKRLIKEMADGDIKNAQKDMTALKELSRVLEQTSSDILEFSQSFDMNAYIANGEFAEQMLIYCEELGVNAIGENNNYELFPYKVKLDAENAEVALDRKKVPYLRPQSLVKFIRTQIDKIMGASFNPSVFAGELSQAYDLYLIVQAKEKNRKIAWGADVYLTALYKYLTPMRRFRKDYDMQSFAFDVARLYSSDIKKLENGKNFQFGPSRNMDKSIRVVDSDSKEHYLSTVRFFEA
jgi:hypothetical protein